MHLDMESYIGSIYLPAVVILLAAMVGYWFLQSQGGGRSTRGVGPVPPPSVNSRSTVLNGEKKVFTRNEVAQHNKRDDCWLIVDAKVYDVTEYVEEHPGEDAILRNAGGDATEGFHGPQHPSRVVDHITEYYIGELSDL